MDNNDVENGDLDHGNRDNSERNNGDRDNDYTDEGDTDNGDTDNGDTDNGDTDDGETDHADMNNDADTYDDMIVASAFPPSTLANLHLANHPNPPEEDSFAETMDRSALLSVVRLNQCLSYNTSSTGMVVILVGKTERTAIKWLIDGQVLRESSDLVRLNYRDRGVIYLRGPHPLIFNIYAAWLYSRRLVLYKFIEPRTENDPQGRYSATRFEYLVEAYILAEYMQDMDFQDTVIDAMAAFITRRRFGITYRPDVQIRRRLYDNTKKDSAARFMLSYHFARFDEPWHHNDHVDFLNDVLEYRRLIKARQRECETTTLESVLACRFHLHMDGEMRCPREKFSQPWRPSRPPRLARSWSA